MYELLDGINSPHDLGSLTDEQLLDLSGEIRRFLIDNVSKTGGHLSSNLGTVELTLALHRAFNAPRDKIIWDVGHQSYTHKIITGRRRVFHTLRQFGGISGFPKQSESEYDAFNTGHSGTSISVALGLCAARDLKGEAHHIAAVIGDGAISGGLPFEALNHVGHSGKKVIIILNDNEMSISKNVGALARYLSKVRLRPGYYKTKRKTLSFLQRLPLLGGPSLKLIRAFKKALRFIVTPGIFFEQLGLLYFGPVDGHNLSELSHVLNQAKNVDKPVLVHVRTKKGKGHPCAENAPDKYHGVPPFDCSVGLENSEPCSFSAAFGSRLSELALKDGRIVSISPSMPVACGLGDFAQKYPARFFDPGIAEAHAVTFAAGLAAGGMIPVVSTYSSFLQRAYDNILHDVAIGNHHVVFAVDRAGLVGEDGETHQGVFDLSYLAAIPNMSILAPADTGELSRMLDYAVLHHGGPIAIRYPKTDHPRLADESFVFGKALVLRVGFGVTLAAAGTMVHTALAAGEILKERGISAEVISLRTLKPLDFDTIMSSVKKTGLLVTLEDNAALGGVGERICAHIAAAGEDFWVVNKAFPDKFIAHGRISELMEKYGMTAESIAKEAEEAYKKKLAGRQPRKFI